MEVFNDYAYCYDLFYKDKNYDSEAKQIQELLNIYSKCTVGQSILNMGCGTGKHDFALSKLGYLMTGIDRSPEMIEVAQREVRGGSRFFVADIREYYPEIKYDAVISLFHVTSYQIENEDVLGMFKTASKALYEGGIFIFDVWYGPGVLTDRPSVRVKEIEDENNLLVRYANPVMYAEDNVVDVIYKILIVDKASSYTKKIEEIHRMRYFFKPEVEFMLKQAGFNLLACVDCNSLEKTDYNSWTAYFIAMKN